MAMEGSRRGNWHVPTDWLDLTQQEEKSTIYLENTTLMVSKFPCSHFFLSFVVFALILKYIIYQNMKYRKIRVLIQ